MEDTAAPGRAIRNVRLQAIVRALEEDLLRAFMEIPGEVLMSRTRRLRTAQAAATVMAAVGGTVMVAVAAVGTIGARSTSNSVRMKGNGLGFKSQAVSVFRL
ncbi:MAG: DUF2619 domain-containing protein [Acidobacteria bacterium]|nr:MAG: DUF2619 domain-containing protein [Acidobacteriota bacterium]